MSLVLLSVFPDSKGQGEDCQVNEYAWGEKNTLGLVTQEHRKKYDWWI